MASTFIEAIWPNAKTLAELFPVAEQWPCAALVIQVFCLLAGTICSDLVRAVEQLCVYPVAHNQPINTILARASALVTSDAQHGQLADDVSE
jgi:hypothetical protein